jgi:hypothetical protein
MFDQYGDFKRQLPDRDPGETQDWVDSLDSIVETGGGPSVPSSSSTAS